MITNLLIAFAISVIYIFVKAFQQQNVIHQEYKWVLPTSFVMAACEVTTIGMVAWHQTYWMIIPIGLGGGIGCIASMYLHKRMRDQ